MVAKLRADKTDDAKLTIFRVPFQQFRENGIAETDTQRVFEISPRIHVSRPMYCCCKSGGSTTTMRTVCRLPSLASLPSMRVSARRVVVATQNAGARTRRRTGATRRVNSYPEARGKQARSIHCIKRFI